MASCTMANAYLALDTTLELTYQQLHEALVHTVCFLSLRSLLNIGSATGWCQEGTFNGYGNESPVLWQ